MQIESTNDSPHPEIARCRREIAEIERLIRSGHPDQEGLCMALLDWSAELSLIEKEIAQAKTPPASDPAAV